MKRICDGRLCDTERATCVARAFKTDRGDGSQLGHTLVEELLRSPQGAFFLVTRFVDVLPNANAGLVNGHASMSLLTAEEAQNWVYSGSDVELVAPYIIPEPGNAGRPLSQPSWDALARRRYPARAVGIDALKAMLAWLARHARGRYVHVGDAGINGANEIREEFLLELAEDADAFQRRFGGEEIYLQDEECDVRQIGRWSVEELGYCLHRWNYFPHSIDDEDEQHEKPAHFQEQLRRVLTQMVPEAHFLPEIEVEMARAIAMYSLIRQRGIANASERGEPGEDPDSEAAHSGETEGRG